MTAAPTPFLAFGGWGREGLITAHHTHIPSTKGISWARESSCTFIPDSSSQSGCRPPPPGGFCWNESWGSRTQPVWAENALGNGGIIKFFEVPWVFTPNFGWKFQLGFCLRICGTGGETAAGQAQFVVHPPGEVCWLLQLVLIFSPVTDAKHRNFFDRFLEFWNDLSQKKYDKKFLCRTWQNFPRRRHKNDHFVCEVKKIFGIQDYWKWRMEFWIWFVQLCKWLKFFICLWKCASGFLAFVCAIVQVLHFIYPQIACCCEANWLFTVLKFQFYFEASRCEIHQSTFFNTRNQGKLKKGTFLKQARGNQKHRVCILMCKNRPQLRHPNVWGFDLLGLVKNTSVEPFFQSAFRVQCTRLSFLFALVFALTVQTGTTEGRFVPKAVILAAGVETLLKLLFIICGTFRNSKHQKRCHSPRHVRGAV